MIKDKWNKILFWGLCIFVLFCGVFYFIGARNLEYLPYSESQSYSTPSQVLVDLSDGVIVEQQFLNSADIIEGVTVRFGTYSGEAKQGVIYIRLVDEEGTLLSESTCDVESIQDSQDVYFGFGSGITVKRDTNYRLVIEEHNDSDTRSVALWGAEKRDNFTLTINNVVNDYSSVYVKLSAMRNGDFNKKFALCSVSVFVIFIALCLSGKISERKGKRTPVTECVNVFYDYTFLLKQLIGKEFAIKYRRSYLGIVWVILNPLLTMIMLSAVFSYVFRFNIENFPVYLILGQVTFNFFSEATQVSITTIVGSGSMIKKVYVPKYIFPLSKVIFSFLNFILSFIPVALVMLFYRIPVSINLIYMPCILFFYFLFTLGIGLLLSAMDVFMRDTQYLFGIVVTLLGYLTPIFYSIDNISPRLRSIMSFNPLYQYINCVRTIMLNRMTPSVEQISICMIWGVVSLFIGFIYFYKKQDKFILFI